MRSGAKLAAVALAVFLLAPHVGPAADRAGIGARLRQALHIRGLPGRPPAPVQDVGRQGLGAPSPAAGRAVAWALARRGASYRWGAAGPAAFDCSGLTWAAYRAVGIGLPRTARDQFHSGAPRVPRAALKPGDLVFFRSRGPSGWHVGLYAGQGRMVEAPQRGAAVRLGASTRPGYLGAVRPAVRGGWAR